MDRPPDSRLRTTGVFLHAALVYWTIIWPQAHREIARLRATAAEIEDPIHRAAALENLDDERGNLEGAAAFAVLAPRRRRRRLVTALVAFQATYDYVDTLAENQPADYSEAAVRQQHLALRDAVTPRSDAVSARRSNDGFAGDRYLQALVDRCRGAIDGLDNIDVVRPSALRAVEDMGEYQVRNHGADPARQLARWQHHGAIGGAGYRWWETAASAASSLVVFALLALAASEHATPRDADEIVRAYVPVGALHVLLDSHADRRADERSGEHSLVAHYRDAATTTTQLSQLAAKARDRLCRLRRGSTHLLIVSAMASFYLHGDKAHQPAGSIQAALGPFARATDAILRCRDRHPWRRTTMTD